MTDNDCAIGKEPLLPRLAAVEVGADFELFLTFPLRPSPDIKPGAGYGHAIAGNVKP